MNTVILSYIYVVVFTSAAALIYLRSIEASYFIQYGVKVLSLISYVIIGIKAEIVTREKLNILYRMITFRNADGKFSRSL